MRAAVLGTLLLAGCFGSAGGRARLLWTHDGEATNDNPFLTGVFREDVVLLDDPELQLLDAKTGAVKWSRPDAGWVDHPVGALEPLVRLVKDARGQRLVALVALDPATGADRGKPIAIDSVDVRDVMIHVVPGALLLWFDLDKRLRAVDLKTGKTRWEIPLDAEGAYSPMVFDDFILFSNPYVAIALADGTVRWTRAETAIRLSVPTVLVTTGGIVLLEGKG